MPPLDPRLKLRHFALVVAIEESGSLRKAADRLHITQAAASSLLAELEFVLGETLFSRSRSGTRSTASGRLLVERARPILSNIRSAMEAIQQARDGVAGEVHIGTLQAAAMTILPLALSIMRQQTPAVRFHVVEGPARQLIDSLLRGNLDLVIGRVPPV
ncbi:MAG TPA: LysR family transcriptional regulator, partial [Devosia sp.]|nr:LysR family transcriptional regulator [Devosia sp.]